MPSGEQIFIGVAVAAGCLLGLLSEHWLLEQTRKGRRLERWLGKHRAIWVLRVLLLLGMIFGILLAINVIRPLHWSSA